MTMLTVSQPNSATGIALLKKYVTTFKPKDLFIKMYVSREKNVCKSKNNMKPFFFYSQLFNTVFLLVLVIMDKLSDY